MDHEDNIFDDDDALDYIMSEEAENGGTGNQPQGQSGCLGLVVLVLVPIGLKVFTMRSYTEVKD